MKSAFAWGLIQGANALHIIAGILIAHIVSPSDFGRFATLSAALTIMLSILNPLINETAQRIASSRGVHLPSLTKRSIYSIITCVIIATLSCATIVEGGAQKLFAYAILPIAIVGHSWVIGALSGLHRMITSGATQIASATARIAILAPFLYYAPSFSGVLWSYAACFVITILLAWPLLGKHLNWRDSTPWNTNWVLIAGFFTLALPFSLDQTIIQALHPHLSGDYGALMTYAKSVMLIASPALTIAYSAAVQTSVTRKDTTTHIKIAALVALLATLLASALWLAHPYLFPLLLGPKYPHIMPHLSVALAAIAMHVISYYLVQLLLLTSPLWLCALLAIPALLQCYLLSALNNPAVSDLARTSLIVFTLQLALAGGASVVCAILRERS